MLAIGVEPHLDSALNVRSGDQNGNRGLFREEGGTDGGLKEQLYSDISGKIFFSTLHLLCELMKIAVVICKGIRLYVRGSFSLSLSLSVVACFQ